MLPHRPCLSINMYSSLEFVLFWQNMDDWFYYNTIYYIPIEYQSFHHMFFFNIVILKVLLFDGGIWRRMRAYFHLCTKMKWCMLYGLRFDTANHWIPSELTLCYWIFMFFLSHNGTKSNHYFILSFLWKSATVLWR